MYEFDYISALERANPDQIAKHLSKNTGFNYEAAREKGVSPESIIDHLFKSNQVLQYQEKPEWWNEFNPEEQDKIQRSMVQYNQTNPENPISYQDIPNRAGVIGTIKEFGSGLKSGLTDKMPQDFARFLRNTFSEYDPNKSGVIDRFIDEQTQDMQGELPSAQRMAERPIQKGAYEGASNIPTSMAAMAPGLAVGLVNPVAGVATTMGGSGAVFYGTSKDQFLEDVGNSFQMANGRKPTDEEWKQIYNEVESAAVKSGLWEAGTEAAGAAFSHLLFMSPVGKMVGNMFAKAPGKMGSLGRFVGKTILDYGEEVGGETVAEKKQSDLRQEVGLADETKTYSQAFKDVAIPTAFATGPQAGGLQALSYINGKLKAKPQSDTDGQDTNPIDALSNDPEKAKQADKNNEDFLNDFVNNADKEPDPFQNIADQTKDLPEWKQWESDIQNQRKEQSLKDQFPKFANKPDESYSDTIPFAEVPNAEEQQWINEIERQRKGPSPQEKNQARINQQLSDEERVEREKNQAMAGKSDFLQKLDMMQDEVNSTRTKGVNQEPVNQQGETIGFSSDSPKWMRELPPYLDDKGKKRVYGRKQLNAVFNNIKTGKKLTPAQSTLYDHIKKAADTYTGENGELVAQDEANDLEKKGYDLLGGKKVSVANLNKGDKFVGTVDGVKDEFEVKDTNEQGETLLQDGITKRVDMFDSVSVEGIKRAKQPDTEPEDGKGTPIQEGDDVEEVDKNRNKPRLAEDPTTLYKSFVQKSKDGVVSQSQRKILYPYMQEVGDTKKFVLKNGELSVLSQGGEGYRAATESESNELHNAISRDAVEVSLLTHWGGTMSDKLASKQAEVLHNPSGNSFKQKDSPKPPKQETSEPITPTEDNKEVSVLGKTISSHPKNIRGWFKDPSDWKNKERLTYKEVAEQIANDIGLKFGPKEVKDKTDKSFLGGKTKTEYVVSIETADGFKDLRSFPKEIYDYYQSILEYRHIKIAPNKDGLIAPPMQKVKELSEGQPITFKTKKGEVSGTIIKKKGKYWEVKKENGKKTLVAEKDIKAGETVKTNPVFSGYDEALEYIETKSKEYGSKGKYLASEEYKKLYPYLETLRQQEILPMVGKAEKALEDAGVNYLDTVEYSSANPFGQVFNYKGVVKKDNDGLPYVQLSEKPSGTKSKVRWHKGFKSVGYESNLQKSNPTKTEQKDKAKEPWEMTLDEWNQKDHKFRFSGKDSYYIRSEKKNDEVLWSGTRSKKKIIPKQHKYEVQRAIEEGKIKNHPDYPELTPDATQSGQTNAKRDTAPDSGEVDNKTKLVIKRIRTTANKLKKDSEEKYNQDRQENTNRRARMAANARADASKGIQIAKTMLNIADLLEGGYKGPLEKIKSKTHIQTLESALNVAQYERWKKEGLSYIDQQQRKGEAYSLEDVKHIKFDNTISIHGSHVNGLRNDLMEHRGGKKLARQIHGENLTPALAKELVDFEKKLKKKGVSFNLPWTIEHYLKIHNRNKAMGITSTEDFRALAKEYIELREGTKKEDPIKAAERKLIGQKPGIDFFPTPKTIANDLVERADIQDGDIVLEPSAGKGDIADVIKEQHPEAELETVEMSNTLVELLELKKHKVVGSDFLDHTGEYDKIIMNPPFSKGMDVDHVKHAYSLLKPGGKIVAIMGEHPFFASDKKSKEFREWISDKGFDEKLPEKSFTGKEAFRQTGVNSRIVEIDKPLNGTKFQIDNTPKSAKLKGKAKLKALIQEKKDKKNARILVEKRNAHLRQSRRTPKQKFLELLGSRDSTGKTHIIPAFSKSQRQIRKIAKGLGLNAVFFRTDEYNNIEGFTHPPFGNEIYLNKTGKYLLSIAGHESLHQLRANHPDLYDFLVDTISVSDENFQKFYNEQLSPREGDFTGLNMDADKVMEELIAHFVGDQFTKPEFWQTLSRKNPTLTEKVFNVIKEVLSKIKGYITRGEQYVDNIDDLQNAVAFAYSEAMRSGNKSTVQNSSPLMQTAKIAEGWYSQLKNFLRAKLNNAPAKMMKDQVESWAKKGEFKKEELEWSGLVDWLDSKDGKVTKQEVMDFLDQNQVEIKEVVKGGPTEEEIDIFLNDEVGEGFTRAEAREYLQNDETDTTKFSNYQLPGGPLSRDTEILTDSGWKRMDVVEIGDIVLSRKDDGGILEWVPVEAKPTIFSEKLYHFKSKSIDMMVSPCHQMVVEKRIGGYGFNRRRELMRMTAEDLWNTHDCRIPLTGKWEGDNPTLLFGKDPGDIMEFIGWFISEGWSVIGNGKKTTLGIGQSKEKNPEKSDRLEKLLDRLGFKWNYVPSGMAYYVGIKSIPEELKELCHAQGNASGKFIPKELFDLDINLLKRLQESLILGDGCTSLDGKGIRKPCKTYFTTSKQLADDFQKLTLLIGKHSRITIRKKNDKQINDLYCIGVNHMDYSTVDDAKFGMVEYNDTAFCVTVKNHAIYVRRNGIAAFTGNSNYKEILLTLPENNQELFDLQGKQLNAPEKFTEQDQKRLDELFNKAQEYKSPHWDEPNVIAHIRMSEREVDGKRVLHIEEIQSDYGQDARKKGIERTQKQKAEAARKLLVDQKIYNSDFVKTFTDQEAIQKAETEGTGFFEDKNSVPNAPFIGKTKTWSMLAMKKMVRYAAENGFDAIAWTQGQEQADRYDLSKQVDSIEYDYSDSSLMAYDKEGNQVIGKTIPEKDLEANIGKEATEKLIAKKENVFEEKRKEVLGFAVKGGMDKNQAISDINHLLEEPIDKSDRPTGEQWKRLSDAVGDKIDLNEIFHDETSIFLENQDLKVGGSGMKSFYDSILPNEVNKFFGKKAWGNARVGEIDIETDQPAYESGIRIDNEFETISVHSLPITPKMKQKALYEGMPLFQSSQKLNTATEAFKKWFGDSKVVDENGDPLVVYHGTKEVFNEFKSKYSDGLFFFTPDPKFAERWARGRQKEKPRNFFWSDELEKKSQEMAQKYLDMDKVDSDAALKWYNENKPPSKYLMQDVADAAIIPVYLSIQKPFIPHKDFLIVKDLIDPSIHEQAQNGAWLPYENKKIVDRLTRLGFDGIYLKEGNYSKKTTSMDQYSTIAAFSPTQIKSIYNKGTFDPNNPDIRFQTATYTEQEDSFSVEDNSSITDDFKYNVVDILSPVSKVYKAIKKTIPEYADFRLKEQLRVSKAKGEIEKAETKYFKPIKRLIGMAKLTVADVDEFLYARHAPEANARLRLTNARHYLNQLAMAQKGGKLKKKLDALDAQFELMNFPTKEIQKAYKTLLESELNSTTTERLEQAQLKLQEFEIDDNPAATEKDTLTSLEKAVSKAKQELKVKSDWEKFSEKPSGMTDAEAAKLSEKWKDNKTMLKIAKLFDQMNNEGLDISHEAGRLSDEEYEAVKGTFDYYAPLFREGHEKKRAFSGIGSGVKNLGTDVKTRGGSTKRAVHILANAFVNHEKTIINAKKAEVAKAFLAFVKMNPNKDFWEFEETKTKAAYDSHGNIKRVVSQNIEPNEVKVKADGKVHVISANPDNVHAMRILGIIQGNQHMSGPIIGALSRLNRILAAVNTTWNPEFVISNLTRDLQTAALNLTDTEVSSMRTKIFKSVPSAMKGLHSLMRGDGSHEWANIAKQYEKSGAKIGWIDYGNDIENKAKNLESQIDLFREGHKTKKAIVKLFDFIEDYNSIVENAVRLSTFKAGIDSGMTEAKAAIMAKGLTVNFNQKGAYGPVINSLYLFANAGIQGSTRIVKNIKNNPKTMAKILGGAMSAATMLSIANSGIGGDDDDGIPYYDKIDTYLKARNMIFMLPGTKGDFIKIPLPWGYNVFWAMGTEIGDALTQKGYNPLDGVSRMVSTALDAFNPLQSATVLQTLSPTISDPFVQVGENKTFFGSPLMPEGNPFDKTPTPDSERYWKSVRTTSRLLAKGLNASTGGDKIKPGLVDISPETLDLIFDTFTGGAGRFILDTAAVPINAIEGDLKPSKVPGIRRVYGQKSEYKTTSDYRKNITHIYQLAEQAKTYPEKKASIYKDKTYFLLPSAKRTESKIRKLNKQLKMTKSRERQEKIKDKIEKLKQSFNKRFIDRSAS